MAKKAMKRKAAKKKPGKKSSAHKVLRKPKKVIALFPEAAFGPALNSVGIGQALEKFGHKVVFLSDPGFLDVYKGYGFEAHPVNLSDPLPPEEMAKFWVDFVNGHIPNFRKTPYDQIDNYVKSCWEMIVETARWAQKDLPGVLNAIKPDVVCVDNVGGVLKGIDLTWKDVPMEPDPPLNDGGAGTGTGTFAATGELAF